MRSRDQMCHVMKRQIEMEEGGKDREKMLLQRVHLISQEMVLKFEI